jgi:hypothetical protein
MTIKPFGIREIPLTKTFFKKGYLKSEVNDYKEAVIFVVNKNAQELSNSELKQLMDPPLKLVQFRQGYDAQNVDHLIQEINKMLQGYMRHSE